MIKKATILVFSLALGAAVGAALGYGYMLRYKSSGVLDMNMGITEYKRISELARTAESVRGYSETVALPAGVAYQSIAGQNWLSPLPAVSRADAKDIPDLVIQQSLDMQKKERAGERGRVFDREDSLGREQAIYMGVELAAVSRSAETAAELARWFGGYIRDVAVRESSRALIAGWLAEDIQFSDRAAETRLQLKFQLEQAQVRADGFKRIIAMYPAAANREAGQVVDIRKDNEKFLSPSVQLVAAESEMLAAREDLVRLDRDLVQHAFARALAAGIQQALAQPGTGAEALARVEKVVADARVGTKSDVEVQQASKMLAALSDIRSRFLSRAQFLSPPAPAVLPERPDPKAVVLIGGLIAVFAAAIWLWRFTLLAMMRRAFQEALPSPRRNSQHEI